MDLSDQCLPQMEPYRRLMAEEQQRGPEGNTFENIESDYANNIALEQTGWDLKLMFGEYSGRLQGVEYHTSITIPWAQAKLLLYFLKVNVEAYEAEHGKIYVPPMAYPPDSSSIPPDSNPTLTKIAEIIDRNRTEFLNSLK